MKHLTTVALILFLFSCSKEQYSPKVVRPPGCDSTFFTFEKNIRTIFNSNCNFHECHATGGRAGYDFTDYASVASRIRSGTMDYRLDLPADDPQHMPEKFRLSPCDYFIIKTWILQGYVKN